MIVEVPEVREQPTLCKTTFVISHLIVVEIKVIVLGFFGDFFLGKFFGMKLGVTISYLG